MIPDLGLDKDKWISGDPVSKGKGENNCGRQPMSTGYHNSAQTSAPEQIHIPPNIQTNATNFQKEKLL